MMKPIIFSTPMIKAILEGQKTQTRRVMKPQPVLDNGFWRWHGAGWSDSIKRIMPIPCHSMYNNAPYRPGDILWVKETWQYKNYGDYGDTPDDFMYRTDANETWVGPWRSPRYMPRKAARIFLKVKDVRAERLQDITEEDVRAEGFITREEFARYWDNLNAKRGYSWDDNPWVWVIEFEKIKDYHDLIDKVIIWHFKEDDLFQGKEVEI